jgi:hypothetical protein
MTMGGELADGNNPSKLKNLSHRKLFAYFTVFIVVIPKSPVSYELLFL